MYQALRSVLHTHLNLMLYREVMTSRGRIRCSWPQESDRQTETPVQGHLAPMTRSLITTKSSSSGGFISHMHTSLLLREKPRFTSVGDGTFPLQIRSGNFLVHFSLCLICDSRNPNWLRLKKETVNPCHHHFFKPISLFKKTCMLV